MTIPVALKALRLHGVMPDTRNAYDEIDGMLALERFKEQQQEPNSETPSFTSPKDEVDLLRAEKMRFDLELKRGQFVKREDVTDTVVEIITRLRSSFKALAPRLAPQLTNISDASVIVDILAGEIGRCLLATSLLEAASND